MTEHPYVADALTAPSTRSAHPQVRRAESVGVRARVAVRRRPALAAVVTLGVLLRIAVTVTYRPAMEFFGDSVDYLHNASHLGPAAFHPVGYPVLLRMLSPTGSLLSVAVAQHVLGVATGLLVYRLVRRAHGSDVVAALAAAPVLLDAYQVAIEQFVLSDAVFTFLVVAGLVAATRRVLTAPAVVGSGLLLSAATLVRTVGLAVIVVVAGYWVLRRLPARRLAAGALAVALPLLGYAAAYDATLGGFALQGMSGRFLYGEVAPFADCSRLPLSATERLLCPVGRPADRPGINFYVWSGQSPYHRLIGTDAAKERVAGSFARQVIVHQPLDYAATVLATTTRYFAPGRDAGPRGWYPGSWQFYRAGEPLFWHAHPATSGFHNRPARPSVLTPLVGPLRAYQRVGYTPGPLLAVCALLALVGAAARRGQRRAGEAAVLLLAGAAGIVAPSASVGFDYRYVLPDLALLPAAGAIGWVLLRRRLSPAPAQRSWAAPVTTAAAAAAVVGTAATVAMPGVYATAGFRPAGSQPVGVTQAVGQAVTVTVGAPRIVDQRCVPGLEGHPPNHEWRLDLPVTVTGASGARLVGPDNLGVRINRDTRTPFISAIPYAPLLPTTVLHSGQRVAGTVEVWFPATRGTVIYQDGFGGGAAAWTFDVTPPPGLPATCTGTP